MSSCCKIKEFFFHLFLATCILLLVRDSSAQSELFKNYGVKDGLPSSEVYYVMQDAEGYMWFCSDRGVSRFNGYEFKTFTTTDGLADNTIFECKQDHKDRIWFRSYSGKLSYYLNDSIYSLPINDTLVKILKAGKVEGMYIDRSDNIYLTSYRLPGIIKVGLNKTNDISFIPILTDLHYMTLFEGGEVLAGNADNAKKPLGDSVFIPTYIISNNGPVPAPGFIWKFPNIKNPYANGNYYRSIKLDDNSIALGYHNQLMILKNNEIINKIHFDSPLQFLKADSTYGIWVMTRGQAPLYYKNGKINSLSVLNFLKGKVITSVYIDREGGVWFTSLAQGVYYLNTLAIKFIDSQSGLSGRKVNFIATLSDKKVLIGLDKNVITVFDNDSISHLTLPVFDKFPKSYFEISAISIHSDSSVWVSTSPGLYIYESINKFKLQSFFHLPMARLESSILKADEINYFAAGSSRLLKVKRKNGINALEEDQIVRLKAFSLCRDRNNSLLVATINGVMKYVNDTLMPEGNVYPILKNRIDDMKPAPNGDMWFATRNIGVIVKHAGAIFNFTKANGLLSDFCKCICLDKNGNVWIGSNEGISRITVGSDESGKIIIKTVQNISGPTLGEVNHIACVNKMVYVGTNNGLTYFNMDEVRPNKIPPPVYITGFKVNGREVAERTPEVLLNYDENYIVVDFVGLTYQDAGNVEYRYKMEGVDTTWVYTKYRNVPYPKLPPGDYKFVVNAKNNDGVWSTSPSVLRFTINPPFWETWWLRSLVVGLIVCLIYWRIKVIEKREKEKTKINNQIATTELRALRAQLNPHFLFNSLNTLTGLVEEKSDNAPRFVDELSKFYRYSFQHSEKEFTALETELKQVEGYLFMLKIRFEDHLKVVWKIEERYNKYLISTHSLQLLFENITKHNVVSAEKPLWIEVSTTHENTLIVKNQLQPKKANNNSVGLGLTSINERYNLLFDKSINIIKTSDYFSVELPLISQQENENIDH